MNRLSARPGRRLRDSARGVDRLIGEALVASGALLAAGVIVPSVTIQNLFVFSRPISLLKALESLWLSGQLVLFLVIAVFSVAFPAFKICLGLALWYGVDIVRPGAVGWLTWLERFGKWSMLDVFVAALMVVAINLSLFASVSVHSGLYLLVGSILVSMIAFGRLVRMARLFVAD